MCGVLWGNDYESRRLTSEDEFIGPYDEEFIALNDSDLKTLLASNDSALPQPRGMPGEKGIPSLERFYTPDSHLGFRTVHFETDQHVLKEKTDLNNLAQVVQYLKKNPGAYLLVEGHTDERASAGYNMALGMRRSNYIRGLLVKQGINLNRIYAVSHGKEAPAALGHSSEDWYQNRRAEFKLFEP